MFSVLIKLLLFVPGKRSPYQETDDDIGLTPLKSPRKRRPPSTSDEEKENFIQPRVPSSANKSRVKITPTTPCKISFYFMFLLQVLSAHVFIDSQLSLFCMCVFRYFYQLVFIFSSFPLQI